MEDWGVRVIDTQGASLDAEIQIVVHNVNTWVSSKASELPLLLYKLEIYLGSHSSEL